MMPNDTRSFDIDDYALDDQIGIRLRLALQRHTAIFFGHIAADLTQTQFAVVARLWEYGPNSQNELGRLAGVATPTIDHIVHLASVALGRDLRADALTLDRMGLSGVSKERFLELLEDGFGD